MPILVGIAFALFALALNDVGAQLTLLLCMVVVIAGLIGGEGGFSSKPDWGKPKDWIG